MAEKFKNPFSRSGANEGESHLSIEAKPGENLDDYAIRLILAASERNGVVQGEFSGVPFEVTSEMTIKSVRDSYAEGGKKQDEVFRASPEAKKRAEEQRQRAEEAKRSIEALLKQLDTLEFSDLESVIDWIAAFQEPTNLVGIEFDRKAVLKTFKAHGFEPDANIGEAYDERSAENVAKYVVGQALAGIERGGLVPQAIHGAASRWRRTFGRESKTEEAQAAALRRRIGKQQN